MTYLNGGQTMDKFYCIECGEVEVYDENDMCDECAEMLILLISRRGLRNV